MTTEQTPSGTVNDQPGADAAAAEAAKAAADKVAADAAAKAAAETPEAKAAAEKATKDAADAAAKAAAEKVVPEKYEFKAPEGAVLDTEVVTAFADVAKELGLPQASAQKVIDKLVPVLKTRGEASVAQVKADLLAASQADKEFGGEKLAENVAIAALAIDAYFTPAFKTFLNETGLGNHPEMIRGLLKIAQPLKQDKHVSASGAADTTNDARSFFPNSQMNP